MMAWTRNGVLETAGLGEPRECGSGVVGGVISAVLSLFFGLMAHLFMLLISVLTGDRACKCLGVGGSVFNFVACEEGMSKEKGLFGPGWGHCIHPVGLCPLLRHNHPSS